MMIAALAAAVIATCPWQDRGLDRFMGDIPSAVDTYTDIPKATREALKAKMRVLAYDDIAHLTASGHRSASWVYGPPTMMHFGSQGRVCRTVDISKWKPDDPGERGLVYCADGHCVTVFTVCRNVSRVARIGPVTPPKGSPPATVLIPPIEAPGGFEAPITSPRMSLAFVDPPPVTFQPLDLDAEFAFVERTDEPWRITADQPWYDLWQWRPLLGPIPQRTFVPVVDAPMVPPPTFPAVPGVVPPAYPFPDRLPPAPSVPGLPSGDVPVVPVPEPSTWALMLVGLVWVFFAVSRRKGSND